MRIVVKIGGAALDDKHLMHKCAQSVSEMAREGHKVVVVHGGGAALTRVLKQLGKTSEFINGLRVTDAETRDVALMVLAGRINKALVATLNSLGQPAVGLCGGDGASFRARKKRSNGVDYGYVGEICSVDSRWMDAILQNGFLPVVSSIALGTDGEYYNINADQMAAACAVACHADALVFLTDVPGVKDADGTVIRWLDLRRAGQLEREAVIGGGMLPKLEACQHALRSGVGRVRILPAEHSEVLPELCFSRVDLGTEVMLA